MPVFCHQIAKSDQKNSRFYFLAKKSRRVSLRETLRDIMPPTGIEPVRYRYRGILSPLRLPVPPRRHNVQLTVAYLRAVVKLYRRHLRTCGPGRGKFSRLFGGSFGRGAVPRDFYLDFSISSRALARLSSVTLSPEIMRASTSTRPSISRVWISVNVRLSRTFFWISSWLSANAAT